MLSKDLVKKIRHIEIKSKRLVDEIFSGQYRSSFRGKGMEFEEIREYYHGDDVRNIDWNVTARYGQAYVKQFSEERELNIFLMIDMSHSNDFGKKKDLIAELGATISFSATRNNDQVGLILFTDHVEKFIPSMKGKRHVLSIIDTILSFEPKSKGTKIQAALEYYDKVMKKRSVLFLISDFMDEGYNHALKSLSKKHDLIMIRVMDKVEEVIPSGAVFTFEDLETGEIVTIDNLKSEIKLEPVKGFNKNNIISIYTDEDYVKKLKMFFTRRGMK
ncbi:MAG: DUF58 domain-containing protein [Vallitaleaceae bacterium]|nr:DUF58 domain-containing protein [Vallitaleaceae bacterium]